jgi:hypothetical protein
VTKPKPAGTPHPFVPDLNLPPHPADLERRGVCARCHLLGRPGDPHHDVPDVPEQAEVARRYEPGGG